MWSWGLGRKGTGYYAPVEMTERQRGSERQMRALAVNDEQVHGWTSGCIGRGGSVDGWRMDEGSGGIIGRMFQMSQMLMCLFNVQTYAWKPSLAVQTENVKK